MDKRSSKRCKVARRFSHGTVLTKSVNENKEKLSLILLKILRIYRKAILFLSMSKLAVMNGRCVFILVQVLLDMTMAVMSSFCLVVMVKELKTRWLRTRFRSKTAIEIFFGNFVTLQRRRVIENELNDDGNYYGSGNTYCLISKIEYL